ncbi:MULTISPECIES: hypothetical protein [unclassified Pseudomonas]|uniref:hypothetical protein n=1 Tax=unclassified Pseudomonas TaxID=196821 RepID=UPI000839A05D|nr:MULTISPECIES: hypothetical protein [unclassified Pseudomonas]QIH08740.1 hypothetical protein ATY02_19415 [Pseudomonas sp. BIOMIG1BAC]
MRKTLLLGTFMIITGTAQAEGIPLFNVACPGNLAVSADQGGPVYINGKEVKSTAVDDRHFQVKAGEANLPISVEADDSVTVNYTDKHGASHLCEAVDD